MAHMKPLHDSFHKISGIQYIQCMLSLNKAKSYGHSISWKYLKWSFHGSEKDGMTNFKRALQLPQIIIDDEYVIWHRLIYLFT